MKSVLKLVWSRFRPCEGCTINQQKRKPASRHGNLELSKSEIPLNVSLDLQPNELLMNERRGAENLEQLTSASCLQRLILTPAPSKANEHIFLSRVSLLKILLHHQQTISRRLFAELQSRARSTRRAYQFRISHAAVRRSSLKHKRSFSC